jgi:hypothetical protein
MSFDSHYAPPRSGVNTQRPEPSGMTPILVGAAIGAGASYVLLTLSGLAFFWLLAVQGVPSQELYARAYQTTWYVLAAYMVSAGCYAFGGYWTSRLASTHGA